MGDEPIRTYEKLSGDKYEINMFAMALEYEITVDGDELTMKELDSG